jgi:hypothetical protein
MVKQSLTSNTAKFITLKPDTTAVAFSDKAAKNIGAKKKA